MSLLCGWFQLYVSVLGFLLGAGIYGPTSLYGVMSIEAAPTHLSGTSGAIVALSANGTCTL